MAFLSITANQTALCIDTRLCSERPCFNFAPCAACPPSRVAKIFQHHLQLSQRGSFAVALLYEAA